MRKKSREGGGWLRLWRRFNYPCSVVILLGRSGRALHFSFKPFLLLALLAVLAGLLFSSLFAFGKLQSQLWRVSSSAQHARNSENEKQQLQAQVDGLDDLLTQLQTVLADFNKSSEFVTVGADSSDIASQKNYEGLTFFPNSTSEEQRLASVRQNLEQALTPLRSAIVMLQQERNILADLPTSWPVGSAENMDLPGGHISFLFGPNLDPISRRIWYLHRGLDIANYPPGLPIKAAATGRVIEARYEGGGYGNYLLIRHKYGYSTRYAHMLRSIVKVGQLVSQGEIIGYMGSTGRSTGSHLHFEIRSGTQLVDPLLYLHMSSANNSIINTTLNAWEGRPYRSILEKDGIYGKS